MAAMAECKLKTRRKDPSPSFLRDRQIRWNLKHPPEFGKNILKCAHDPLHHQNITAPSHDISITDWKARPPNTGVISSISFNALPCSEDADFNIQIELSGRWSRELYADCSAIKSRALVCCGWSFSLRDRRVGSINYPCWERGKWPRSVFNPDSHQRWGQRSKPRGNASCSC